MADSPKRARLVAEIDLLQRQQLDCLENAVFCGWTIEGRADHEKRQDRIELLLRRLAELGEKP